MASTIGSLLSKATPYLANAAKEILPNVISSLAQGSVAPMDANTFKAPEPVKIHNIAGDQMKSYMERMRAQAKESEQSEQSDSIQDTVELSSRGDTPDNYPSYGNV